MNSSSIAAPAVNNVALVYGRGPHYTKQECREIARNFDVMLSVSDPECRKIIKATNPGAVILTYTNSSNCSEGDPLCNFLENQDHPEDYFLNFVTNGVQQINKDIFTRKANWRLCSYGSGKWCSSNGPGTRWTTDYYSERSVKKIVSFFSDVSNLPEYSDGYFFDNMDRGCSYIGAIRSGQVEYNLEKDNNGNLSASPKMEKACNRLRVAMDHALPESLFIVDNISNYGLDQCGGPWWWKDCSNKNGKLSARYPSAVWKTRGVLQEYFYRFTNTFSRLQINYIGLNEIWKSRGKPKNAMYIAWWEDTGTKDIPSNNDRVKMFALGTHLLFQFPAMYIRYDGGNANNVPLKGDWFPAMAVPLGAPTSAYYPIDNKKSTYRRDFSNGVAVVRFRLQSRDNFYDATDYPLGSSYIPVYASGKYGSALSTITLQNAEAFIGIKEIPSVN